MKEDIVNILTIYNLYINIFNKLKVIILSDLHFRLNYKISIKLNYIFLYKLFYNLFKTELKTL